MLLLCVVFMTHCLWCEIPTRVLKYLFYIALAHLLSLSALSLSSVQEWCDRESVAEWTSAAPLL